MNNYEKLLYKCKRQRNQLRKQHKKLTKLNFVIKELEKYCFKQLQLYGGGGIAQEYYDKLQELKGSNGAIPPEVIGTNE